MPSSLQTSAVHSSSTFTCGSYARRGLEAIIGARSAAGRPATPATPARRARSAADRRHGAGGLQERRVVDAVAGALAPHRRPPQLDDLVVGGAGAQRRAQVGLLAGEQAVADLAVG